MRRTARLGAVVALTLLAIPVLGLQAQAAESERFTIISTGPGPATVIASGPITGVGTETNNEQQNGQPFQSIFHLAKGDVYSTVTPGIPDVSFSPRSCVTRIVETDTFVYTGGTGPYAGVTGSGTAAVRVTIVGARTGLTCASPQTPPAAMVVVVQGTGTANVPG